jgi:hypothetical protein
MQSGVMNPELIYRSEGLSPEVAERLRQAGYSSEEVRLLSEGLPITYPEDGAQVVEYPDGRRLEVERVKEYADDGTFVRYRFRVLHECPPAPR